MAQAETDFIIEGRLSFPDLWDPVEFKPGDDRPRWNATILVEPGSASDKAVNAAIKKAAETEWKDKAASKLKEYAGQKNQYCYLSGDLRDYEGYAGMMALSAHRNAKTRNGGAAPRPAIIDRDTSPLTADDGKPYAGCYVKAKVSIYCQSGENPGVRASFSVIQFVKDGDAFSGSAPSVAGFEDLGAPADEEALA
jgi:hypothetical protein